MQRKQISKWAIIIAVCVGYFAYVRYRLPTPAASLLEVLAFLLCHLLLYRKLILSNTRWKRWVFRGLSVLAVGCVALELLLRAVESAFGWQPIGQIHAWLWVLGVPSVYMLLLWGIIRSAQGIAGPLLAMVLIIAIGFVPLFGFALSLDSLLGIKDVMLYASSKSPDGTHEVVVLRSGLMDDTFCAYPCANAMFCIPQENGEIYSRDPEPEISFHWQGEDSVLVVFGRGDLAPNTPRSVRTLIVMCEQSASSSVDPMLYY